MISVPAPSIPPITTSRLPETGGGLVGDGTWVSMTVGGRLGVLVGGNVTTAVGVATAVVGIGVSVGWKVVKVGVAVGGGETEGSMN